MSKICDDLRAALLQYAMQGKLTKQLPEDGNAEDLLEKIKAEKERLIAEGKIKKQKPLAPITDDEIPFEIPENWRWVRWGEIVNVVSARRVHQSDWKSRGVPFYRAREIAKLADNGFVDNELFISNELYDGFLKSGIPKAGDLMVTAVGTLGKSYVVKTQDKFYYKDASVICLENCGCSPYYLQVLMNSNLMHDQIKSNSGGTTVGTLTIVRMNEYIAPLPPLTEQRRIVEKVNELMARVDDLEQSTNALTALKKAFPDDIKAALLQYAMQGKLTKQLPEDGNAEDLLEKIKAEKERLIAEGKIKKQKPLAPITDDEIPFEIPENWRWVRLGELVLLNPKNILSDDTEASFVPMALVNAGYSNSFSYEEKKWSKVKKGFTHFADGDLGVAKITPCFQNRKSVIFHNLKNGVGSGTTELSIMRPYSNEIYRPYLLWFLKTNYFIDGGVRSFTGTAGQQRIHKDYIKLCPMPLPPVAEQKRIVERLDVIFKIVESLQEKL